MCSFFCHPRGKEMNFLMNLRFVPIETIISSRARDSSALSALFTMGRLKKEFNLMSPTSNHIFRTHVLLG